MYWDPSEELERVGVVRCRHFPLVWSPTEWSVPTALLIYTATWVAPVTDRVSFVGYLRCLPSSLITVDVQ